MDIFFIRHGQTIDNENKLISGSIQTPLSAQGHSQLSSLNDFLRKTNLTRSVENGISTSAVRAIESYKSLDLGLEFTHDDDLLEVNAGFYAKKTWDYFFQDFPDTRLQNLSNIKFPGGESYQDLYARTVRAVKKIEATGASSVVVAHGGSIACAIYYLLGIPFSSYSAFTINNGSITHIKRKHGVWRAEFINQSPIDKYAF